MFSLKIEASPSWVSLARHFFKFFGSRSEPRLFSGERTNVDDRGGRQPSAGERELRSLANRLVFSIYPETPTYLTCEVLLGET